LLGADPAKFGFVAGGNMTGLTAVSSELMGKRLDLLREMNPLATTVAYLIDPRAQDSEEPTRAMVAAARELGRQAVILEARSESDIDAAFATLDERGAGALVLGPHVLFQRNAKKIIDLVASHKISAIYPDRGFAAAGGLMSYTADGIAAIRQIGSLYAAQILKGAKPADLPVQQPAKFNLVINLGTAMALGLTIPETLLATADELMQYGWPKVNGLLSVRTLRLVMSGSTSSGPGPLQNGNGRWPDDLAVGTFPPCWGEIHGRPQRRPR
jgi:putative ABC transport system substrate-binding protein